MSEEEIIKQYANEIVDIDKLVGSLIDKFETDKTSVDIQQLQLIAEYLLYKVDKLQEENGELKEELFAERKTNISKYTIKNIIKNKLKEIESDADFETIEVLNELLNKIRLKNVCSFG